MEKYSLPLTSFSSEKVLLSFLSKITCTTQYFKLTCNQHNDATMCKFTKRGCCSN